MLEGSNYHNQNRKTGFCFLDETGLIHGINDRFFALGIIKSNHPEKIYREIRKIRDKYRYYEEFKWSKLDRKIRFSIAREMFKIFLFDESTIFNCIILDKKELNFKKYFDDDLSKVYRSFVVALLKLIIGKTPNEVLVILADDYFTPEKIELEETIKRFINQHYNDFVCAGVCQINSKSSDLLQLTDLILGAIVYDLKKSQSIVTSRNTFKRKFLNFLYQKLSVNSSFFKSPNDTFKRNFIFSNQKIRATIFDCKKSRVNKYNKKQAMTHDG